ncbi:hypothetical protein HNR33_001254 [Brassicibacter mesophilus]
MANKNGENFPVSKEVFPGWLKSHPEAIIIIFIISL